MSFVEWNGKQQNTKQILAPNLKFDRENVNNTKLKFKFVFFWGGGGNFWKLTKGKIFRCCG